MRPRSSICRSNSPPITRLHRANGKSGLKSWLSEKKGFPVPVALTEWNTPNERRRGDLTDIEHVQEIAMQIGMNAVGGLDFAHYWPMRMDSRAFKPLFSLDGGATPESDLFGLIGSVINNAQVSQSLLGNEVYALQSRQTGQDGLILVNNGNEALQINWRHSAADTVTLVRLSGDPKGNTHFDPVCSEPGLGRKKTMVTLPAQSIAIVKTAR